VSHADRHTDADLWPLLDRLPVGVLLIVPNPWRVERANQTAAEWLQTTPEELVGRAVEELFHPRSRPGILFRLGRALHHNENDLTVPFRLVTTAEQAEYFGLETCRLNGAIPDLFGMILHRIERTFVRDRLDPLTGQLDRSFLDNELSALLHAEHGSRPFAVLFIDLDNFKEVNDRHGHLLGDRVLHEAAQRMADCLHAGEQLIRYGGDEFVVLIKNAANDSHVKALVEKIHAAFVEPIVLPEGTVRLTVSIGIAQGPAQFKTPNDILSAADQAMYAAKKAARQAP
jgi:diguanylate cyclase (GGDEF)-like protein